MTPHTPEEWNPFVIVNNTMPPREKQAKVPNEHHKREPRTSSWVRSAPTSSGTPAYWGWRDWYPSTRIGHIGLDALRIG
jgi:hypothetical protein